MSNTSSRPGADDLATLAVRGVSRRTVARTTAWATPVLLTTVAAPAFAGTGVCVDRGTATLTTCDGGGDEGGGDDGGGDDGGGDDGGGHHHHHHDKSTAANGKSKGKDHDTGGGGSTSCPPVTALTFGGATTVTATVDIAATDKAGTSIALADDTGLVKPTPYSPSWNYINLHHPEGMSQGDTLTMTITLNQPVRNFTLRITDIDKDKGSWIDAVSASPAGFGYQAGSQVTGKGTTGDPFVATGQGRIDDTDAAESGDVILTWVAAVQVVTITYVAADEKNGSGIGQHIGVGQIGFDNCA